MVDKVESSAAADGEKKKKSGGQAQKKKGKDLTLATITTYKNKVRALERHLRKFPEDDKADSALKLLKIKGTVTPRKKPKNPRWTSTSIAYAQMAAKVGYNGHVVALQNFGNLGVYAGFKDNFRSAGLGPDMTPAGRARRAAFEEALQKQKDEQQARREQRAASAPAPSAKPAGKPGGKPNHKPRTNTAPRKAK